MMSEFRKLCSPVTHCCFVVAVMFISNCSRSIAGDCIASPCCGDVNFDSVIDVSDLVAYNQYFVFGTTAGQPPNSETDGYLGVTLRDMLSFEAHFLTDLRTLSCPASHQPYELNPNSDFILRHQTVVPPNVTSFTLPLYTDFIDTATALSLPFSVLVGGLPASIDSIAVVPPFVIGVGRKIAGLGTEACLTVIEVFPSASPFSRTLAKYATMKLTFPTSATSRSIELVPLKRPPVPASLDSGLVLGIYESFCCNLPGTPFGWTPVIQNYLCGDVTGDGSIDIGDLTELVDHLFIAFEPLLVAEAGNVDSDGGVDIADLTLLVAHLFAQTPLSRC